jgi:putative transcriptional regulator
MCLRLWFRVQIGFDIRAVQDWEQKRRKSERSARMLPTVIAPEPEAISKGVV